MRIEVECEPGLDLDSFPGPLGQVVSNLVQNAVIHGLGEDGSGVVRIEARAESAGFVRLRVCDDGKGIAPELMSKVFEPFFTTRRGTGGSGLGLHIVHNLVAQKLGGSIHVSANSPRGACFSVVIPRSAP